MYSLETVKSLKPAAVIVASVYIRAVIALVIVVKTVAFGIIP